MPPRDVRWAVDNRVEAQLCRTLMRRPCLRLPQCQRVPRSLTQHVFVDVSRKGKGAGCAGGRDEWRRPYPRHRVNHHVARAHVGELKHEVGGRRPECGPAIMEWQ